MARSDDSVSLSALARLGFAELTEAAASLEELAALLELDRAQIVDGADAADPDAAVAALLRVARRDAVPVRELFRDADARRRAWRVFGASTGLGDFFLRHPDELSILAEPSDRLPSGIELRERLSPTSPVRRSRRRWRSRGPGSVERSPPRRWRRRGSPSSAWARPAPVS
jgi:glutamate-ammonia-ligase adenylyltransferase